MRGAHKALAHTGRIKMAVTSHGETKYAGLVVSVSSGRGDLEGFETAYYAHWWNQEAKRVERECYAHTRSDPGTNGTCEIDATVEVRMQIAQVYAEQAFESWKTTNLDKACRPEVGREVIVTKGRKVKIGTVGVVFWERMQKGWGRWSGMEQRIGMKDAEGTVYWLDGANVEVTHPEEYLEAFADGEYRSDRDGLCDAFKTHKFIDTDDRYGRENQAAVQSFVQDTLDKLYPERVTARLAKQAADYAEFKAQFAS